MTSPSQTMMKALTVLSVNFLLAITIIMSMYHAVCDYLSLIFSLFIKVCYITKINNCLLPVNLQSYLRLQQLRLQQWNQVKL